MDFMELSPRVSVRNPKPRPTAEDRWAPRGTESNLEEATGCLPQSIDRRTARLMVRPIARHFNCRSLLEAQAPTLPASHNKFRRIQGLASQLIGALNRLNVEEQAKFGNVDFEELMHIQKTAAECSNETSHTRNGLPTVLRRFQAPSKVLLTIHCADLLDACGCNVTGYKVISSSNPMTLANLVHATYRYATGCDPEGRGAGLQTYIRKIGGIYSQRTRILQELSTELLKDLPFPLEGAKFNSDYFESLRAKLTEIESDIDQLAGESYWRTYNRSSFQDKTGPGEPGDLIILVNAGHRLDVLTDHITGIWVNGPP